MKKQQKCTKQTLQISIKIFEIKQKMFLNFVWKKNTEDIIIRARARSPAYGERNTKYILNLEKRNNKKAH